MNTPLRQYDAIVVGGGHNGLVAANYLARAGLSTLTLEGRGAPGGCASRIEYFPGYFGSLANSPGSLEPAVVRDLELAEHGLVFDKPDLAVLVPYNANSAFRGWRNRDDSLAEIAKFSKKDADNYYAFFSYLEDFARVLQVNLFEPPPSIAEMAQRAEAAGRKHDFGKIFLGSIEDLLDEWFESSEGKAMIASMATVNNFVGPSTPGTPFRLLQRPLSMLSSKVEADHDPRQQVMRGSTGLPRGGMGAIGEALASSLRASGGELMTNKPVARIDVENGAVAGVTTADGESFASKVVLSNLNIRTTLLNLIDKAVLDPAVREKVDKKRLRGSAFKIGLALSGVPRFAFARDDDDARMLASSQFRIAPTMQYIEDAVTDARAGRWSRKPLVWGLTPSITDPSMAPEGHHVMSLNIFHAPYELAGGLDWSTEKYKFGEHCIDLLTEYIPNLREIIVDKRFWSPVDLEQEFGLTGGNITHGDMMPNNMFDLRVPGGWAEYRMPVKGLYLCGSGAWPGGLISGLPGHNSSKAVLNDLR